VSFFVSPRFWIYPPRPISQDGIANPFRLYRQFDEGISAASINDSGARFTTEFVPGAPVIAVMGDSHVFARNVSDGEPMGAVTANLARKAGHPINVRELGRVAATPIELSLAAEDVLRRWNPIRVFIVVSERFFEDAVLKSYESAIKPDGSGGVTVRAVAELESTAKPPNTPYRRLYWRFRSSSALAELACNNPVNLFRMLRGFSQSDEPAFRADPEPPFRLALAALQQAYGSRLVIVYHPPIGVTGGEEPDQNERVLAALCAAKRIPFIPVRRAMVEDRDLRSRISNGFINRIPGAGHLNANGHRIVGTAIWQFLERESAGGDPGSRVK
jgi:hypothetical protein